MSPGGQRSAAGAPWAWALLALALVAFVVIAAVGTRPPANDREAMLAVAETVKCPTCVGESVAVSEASISKTMRGEIADQLAAGRTPDEIRAYLAQNYGDVVLLDPGTEGVAVLVWVLPLLGLLGAAVGLAVLYRRWGRRGPLEATDEDRRLVADALSLGEDEAVEA